MDDFGQFVSGTLFPGAQTIFNAGVTKVTSKIVGASSGQNNTVDSSVSALGPSGTSAQARGINDYLSKVGGLGVVIPVVLISAVGLYLIMRK